MASSGVNQPTRLFSSSLQRLGRVRLQQIGHIQVQVRGDVPAVLFVAVHRQDLQGIELRRDGRHGHKPALLPHLPQGNGEKIPLPVGVTAQPGPGVIEIVIGQEHLLPVRTHHPGRGGQVGGGVFPGVERLAAI